MPSNQTIRDVLTELRANYVIADSVAIDEALAQIKKIIEEEVERFAQKCLNHSERYYNGDGDMAQVVRCGQINHELAKRKVNLNKVMGDGDE